MKPKLLLGLALVLSGGSSVTIAFAQPGGGRIYTSLEVSILQARVVFRGTITNVSDFIIHSNNSVSREVVLTNTQTGHIASRRWFSFLR